jgi:hypothetical protein
MRLMNIMSRKKRERGQVTAEFIVVLPLLLLFFFLTLDFGWQLKNWLVVTNAAREADRCAIASSCFLNIDGSSQAVDPDYLVQSRIWNGGLTWDTGGGSGRFPLAAPPGITIEYVDLNGDGELNAGDSVVTCIEAESNYISPVIPFLGFISGGGDVLPDPLPLRAREEMLIEFADPQGPLFVDSEGEPVTLVEGDGSCNFGS